MSSAIPKRIIEYAKYLSDRGIPDVYVENRVEVLRDIALEHIRRYKEAKKETAGKEKEVKEIKEWLKTIDHETGK